MGYCNLRAEMARAGVSVNSIAGAIGKSTGSIYGYLKSGRGFNVNDAIIIRDLFFPNVDIEYLFDNKTQKGG